MCRPHGYRVYTSREMTRDRYPPVLHQHEGGHLFIELARIYLNTIRKIAVKWELHRVSGLGLALNQNESIPIRMSVHAGLDLIKDLLD